MSKGCKLRVNLYHGYMKDSWTNVVNFNFPFNAWLGNLGKQNTEDDAFLYGFLNL